MRNILTCSQIVKTIDEDEEETSEHSFSISDLFDSHWASFIEKSLTSDELSRTFFSQQSLLNISDEQSLNISDVSILQSV